jgi:hypothetical protein
MRMSRFKSVCLPAVSFFVLTAMPGWGQTNTAPTVVVQSAAMRPGTTYMDINFRVNDPDDATVKVRALAFIDGVRSFANVLKLQTLVEGTESLLADDVPANTDHTLTWDVGADWDIDLGEVKIEIMARDARGLLPFDWVTVPATADPAHPEVTISLNPPTNDEVLDALSWLYADGDSGLSLENGVLKGTVESGIFDGEALVTGTVLRDSFIPELFLFKKMNLARASVIETDVAVSARLDISEGSNIYAANRPWDENEPGRDPLAVETIVVNKRWLKHIYADGSITMSDRLRNLMWLYNAGGSWIRFDLGPQYCAQLVHAGHDDWFLPDRWQLVEMFLHKGLFSGVSTGEQWMDGYASSTKFWYVSEMFPYTVIMATGAVNTVGPPTSNPHFYVWPCRHVR